MSSSTHRRVKPPALRPGDTIGIVAPASNVQREHLEAGCEGLRRAGYRPFYFDSILDQELYFAGTVERRTRELEEMFFREDVRAIVCARGGYGANYLLQAVDWEKVKAHPKIFVGYSDVTTLLTFLSDDLGWITFHGPMVAKDWENEGGVDLPSWQSALAQDAAWEPAFGADSGTSGLVEGEGEGILYGGCLSILLASLGTPYEIRTEGTILFLEDVAEKPFRIDRMLMQLKLAGKLSGVRGIIFGEMCDCVQNANQGYALQDVVKRILGELGVPIAYGVRSGHVSGGNVTLPIGARARLRVSGGQVCLKILEGTVSI